MRTDTSRPTPLGRDLRCRGWEQEGALRCLLNNIDPEVAENAADLVVYGGRGRAARSHEALAGIVAALETLAADETLLVQSGKAVAVFRTHEDAPRVLISTAMLVPAWSDDDTFRGLEDQGLTMYGQMTAAGSTSARKASSASPTRPSAQSARRISVVRWPGSAC